MTRYVKRPIPVEALQVTQDNKDEVLEFVGKIRFFDGEADEFDMTPVRLTDVPEVFDALHGSWIKFEYGDYIIRGIQGELYPHKGDIFLEVYEEYVEEQWEDAAELEWDLVSTYHVLPINDLIEHVTSLSCDCGPEINEDGIVVHNAADGRE